MFCKTSLSTLTLLVVGISMVVTFVPRAESGNVSWGHPLVWPALPYKISLSWSDLLYNISLLCSAL